MNTSNPSWLKDAIATERGFVSSKGELLKSMKMTKEQVDAFNNKKAEEIKEIQKIGDEVAKAVHQEATKEFTNSEVVELSDTQEEIVIQVTGADTDGDGVLNEAELKRLTKAKLENVARDYGIELDRRKTKKALLEELLEKIAE